MNEKKTKLRSNLVKHMKEKNLESKPVKKTCYIQGNNDMNDK